MKVEGNVTPLFWPHVLKLYMMYTLYLNHGKELKSKALPLIWCCVSGIKVDADGNSAKSSTLYILMHHVTMQLINTTSSYGTAT